MHPHHTRHNQHSTVGNCTNRFRVPICSEVDLPLFGSFYFVNCKNASVCWPNVTHNVSLAQEIISYQLSRPQDWEDTAGRYCFLKVVELKTRGCREHVNCQLSGHGRWKFRGCWTIWYSTPANDKLPIALWTKLHKLLSVCLRLCSSHFSTVYLHVTGYSYIKLKRKWDEFLWTHNLWLLGYKLGITHS